MIATASAVTFTVTVRRVRREALCYLREPTASCRGLDDSKPHPADEDAEP